MKKRPDHKSNQGRESYSADFSSDHPTGPAPENNPMDTPMVFLQKGPSEHPTKPTEPTGPAPDMHQAEAFLNALDPFALQWCFQTFDDGPEKRGHLASTQRGTWLELAPRLQALNAQGAGVFVTVNEVAPGKPRMTENIKRVRAVFADFDDASRDNLAALQCVALEPSILVESSPGKFHAYWLVDDLALKDFRPLQQAIAEKLGTDSKVKDLPRVMRVPGFIHKKGAPELVKLLPASDKTYTMAELQAAFTPAQQPAPQPPIFTPLESDLNAPTAAPRGEHDRYTQRAIERATNAVFSAGPGERNDTLNATTYGLARLAAAGRLDWGQVSQKLERAAVAAGLAPTEIRATLRSAWSKGSTKPNIDGMPRDNGQTLQQLDIDADTGELREPAPHPLALIVAPCEQLQAPRWLLPGFMAEGLTLIAGGHGAGKTTALLPLACGVAGIHEPGWPLAPKHWREVVYIIEDIDQAQRVLHGLACHLGTTAQAIAERVHLVDARRLPADYLVKVGATYRERYTRTVEGVELLPLVLLDTQAATIALENENDNSEASAAVAMLKQHFEGLPVWLVAHVAKANINRTEAMAARGASAWEADANATAFLIKEGEERWLMLGKRRFEPRWPEMQLQSYFKEEVGYDAWGEFETVPLRWAIARPAEGTRAAQQAEAKAAQAAGEEAALRQKIRDTVQSAWQEGNPLNRAAVKVKIRRKTAEVVACIECLLSEGWLLEIHVPREQRTHPRRSDFLINLTSAEREDIRAGLPAPERKTTIPESWKKPFSSVPDTEAEKAPKGGEAAA